MRILRRRPSPAMVVALIALFIALGGPAQAKHVINGKLLGRGTVTGRAIKNGSVAKADLSKAAVKSLERTPSKSVGSAQIIDGQVLAPDLGAAAVTSTALGTGSVTASKLAADSVGRGSVANGSLQTLDIGSFAGAVSVDFAQFTPTSDPITDRHCQAAPALAAPTGGQPNIGDDVVLVTPPSSWPETIAVWGKPAPNSTNMIRIIACWIPPARFLGQSDADQTLVPPDPGPTVFRYVTFDSP